jgi:hypothetical protein
VAIVNLDTDAGRALCLQHSTEGLDHCRLGQHDQARRLARIVTSSDYWWRGVRR